MAIQAQTRSGRRWAFADGPHALAYGVGSGTHPLQLSNTAGLGAARSNCSWNRSWQDVEQKMTWVISPGHMVGYTHAQ